MSLAIDLSHVERERGTPSQPFRLMIEHLRIAAGERVALVGPSGCGKSTCLDLLALTLAPTRAERFRLQPREGEPTDVTTLWQRNDRRALNRLRARHVGYVLQTGGLLPFLSLLENVLLSRRLLGLPCPGPAPMLLEALGVAALSDRLPSRVSIGERQRAAVARAVAHEPSLVLADEPTASLDPANAVVVMKLLAELASSMGLTLVVVSHDADLVERSALRIIPCRVEDSVTIIGAP